MNVARSFKSLSGTITELQRDLTTAQARIAQYRNAIDDMYNDSVNGRRLIIKHFGILHPEELAEPQSDSNSGNTGTQDQKGRTS